MNMSFLRRHRFFRQFAARPRLVIATLAAVATGVLLPHEFEAHLVTRLLIAWNVAAVLYVVLAAAMMIRSSQARMRKRAQLQDEGQRVILILVVLSAAAALPPSVASLRW